MKIHGLNKCLDALKFDENRIGEIMERSGNNILTSTKSVVGQVDSVVSSSYNMSVSKTESGWAVNVGSDIDMAAFLEWGTGDFVVVPPETTDDYTMQWYKNGRGTLRPHAALIPAYRVEREKLVSALLAELKRQF